MKMLAYGMDIENYVADDNGTEVDLISSDNANFTAMDPGGMKLIGAGADIGDYELNNNGVVDTAEDSDGNALSYYDAGGLKLLAYISEIEPVTIGGRTYKTVKIGDQVWMAENLDYSFDGLVVGQGSSSSEPRANYYNNDEGTYGWSGLKYGLLYNWIAVKYLEDHKSELMPGWHVPTRSEWSELATAVGGTAVAGTKLKSTTGWSSGNGDGSYGFEAFPAGNKSTNSFNNLGNFAYFWTSDEYSSSNAYYRYLSTGAAIGLYNREKHSEFSVRLVKDSPVSLLGE